MARTQISQTQFNAGEFSPLLHGRSDIEQYGSALKTATNTYVTVQGPLVRRPGTIFVAEVKDSSKTVSLRRFRYSHTDSFILEFGDKYIRFYTQDGQLIDTSTSLPYEISSPYLYTEVGSLTTAQFGNWVYIAHSNHSPRVLKRGSDDTWTLEELEFSPPPTYEAGNIMDAELTPGATTGSDVTFSLGTGTTFVAADVGRQIINLEGNGKASITSVTDSDTVVATITEDFDSTDALSAKSWKLDLSPICKLTPNNTVSGSIVKLSVSIEGSTSPDAFRSDDLGSYVIINNGVVKLTKVDTDTDHTYALGLIIKSLDSKDATEVWTLEKPEWSSDRGYPSAVALSQNRLWFGGTDSTPQGIWASEIGIYDGFGRGDQDDDSLSFKIASGEVNTVQWIADARNIVVGTLGSEVTITSSDNGLITPSNVKVVTRTNVGSPSQTPLKIGSELVYIPLTRDELVSFSYAFSTDDYDSNRMLDKADHLAVGLQEAAYARAPNSTIYAVRSDGDLLVGSYDKAQSVLGFTRYETQGEFENVQIVPNGGTEEAWFVIKRVINGEVKRYVERLDSGDGSDNLDAFSDCALSYSDTHKITDITNASPAVVTAADHGFDDGDKVKILDVEGLTELNNFTFVVANSTTDTFELNTEDGDDVDTTDDGTYTSGGRVVKLVTTISGLDHLAGETVQIKTDGANHPNKTVSTDGEVTLDFSSYEIVFGLPYTTSIVTLNPEFDTGQGTMQGQRIRWVKPILRVYKSTYPTLNKNFEPSRRVSDKMDMKVPLFTGDLHYGETGWSSTGNLTIQLTAPFPLVLIGVYGSIEGGAP